MKATTGRRRAALVGSLLTGLILLSMASLTACAPQEKILSPSESAPVLAYSEAKTSNMMAGL